MIKILKDADKKKKIKGGRRNKLSMESQLLMALEYIIEYRTYCYASQSYEIRENSCYKGVVKENFIGIIKRFKIISDKYRNRRKDCSYLQYGTSINVFRKRSNVFFKLKKNRRLTMRVDKLDLLFMAFIAIAFIKLEIY